ncbi:hypothetical protein [Xanthomonas hortorum]|uniref:hypothetical protein n=1 Tax=Xanthomonas hortorum TaxID=56454 RepID=UPI0029361C8C|nr:hypothetical protein [Xanthomonas hortorum]MDV2452576.1 hypothetical protein [Xanthomonas hortorum NBC5720]
MASQSVELRFAVSGKAWLEDEMTQRAQGADRNIDPAYDYFRAPLECGANLVVAAHWQIWMQQKPRYRGVFVF